MTTCFGPYSGPSSGHKMNSTRKLYSEIYKMMYVDLKFNEISLKFYRSIKIQRDLVEFLYLYIYETSTISR